MKKIVQLLLIFFTANSLYAQPQGQWTWMNGNNIPDQPAVYGTQSVFAPANTPKGMYEPCQWTDHQGNFWLFGGVCPGFTAMYESDLWKYDPSINQWAWMKGPGISNQNGQYGTLNVPLITNNPGARAYGIMTWVDTAGNLWMYGGYGYDANGNLGNFSDLWKYNIATNIWTWIKGPNTVNNVGTYGTIEVENIANNPGGRRECSATWVDDNTNSLWLFGGYGYDNSSGDGNLSDLWRYNIATNSWTWMKGPDVMNQPSVYGTITVPNPANTPSGRFCFSSWKDDAGDFWIWGGLEYISSNAYHNDLWRYQITTNNWTWMSGTNLNNDTGSVGNQCLPYTANFPKSRHESRACWKRGCNNFEFFGGGNVNTNTVYNDLWDYDVSSNKWTWMSGSIAANQPSNYGTFQISNATNIPSGRSGSVSWKDNNGHLWLWGGQGIGYFFNDMWRFVPDTTCPFITSGALVTSAFTYQSDTGCAPFIVTFNNQSSNGTNSLWTFGDSTTSTATNPVHTYYGNGPYTVRLITFSACNAAPDTIIHTVTFATPPIALFTAIPDSGCNPLTVHFINNSTNATTYHWDFGDGNSSNATSPSHTYNNAGIDTVTLISFSAAGCTDTAYFFPIQVIGAPITTSAFTPTANLQACDSLTVHFINNSTNAIAFLWNFGDTFTSTATNPSHTYTNTGTYTVTLIAFDTTACGTDTDTSKHISQITINASAHASFPDSNYIGCNTKTITFTNNSNNSTSFLWLFGDGNTSTSTSPSHTYTLPGIYTVTLIAYGVGGCNDTLFDHDTVTIVNATISSAFTADTLTGCSPFIVHFTNLTNNGTSFLWNFGDGGTSTAINPIHTYTDSGHFTVTLYAFNDTHSPCGIIADSTIHNTYIIVDTPFHTQSRFAAEPITGCSPIIVQFTENSSNSNTFKWLYGDGTSDSLFATSNPFHIYFAGSYNATLISWYLNNCKTLPDTMSILITVDSCNLYIPNVFSPNNDGKNEFYHLIAEGYSNYHLIIFNRWGLKVFESFDKDILWNGKVNNTGGDAPDGTYYYIFTAIDFNKNPFTDKGFITLIR